ncbi:MAG: hypothetical protein IJA32_14070 [Lachnospiraceae bacterium]|nr:hypothetical protein [Lachnospiraceae bacterium]
MSKTNSIPSTGVYTATKTNGEVYYRSSITYSNKHISLGSFATYETAKEVYQLSKKILESSITIQEYSEHSPLTFHKWVVLINFRDNGIYIKNPIYVLPKYFIYYMSPEEEYYFDTDDLFYYSNHKILKKSGYLFVNDYGMQVNILSRYGIKNFAVAGRDYIFANGNSNDFRYGNIKVINPYYGVIMEVKNGRTSYKAQIHINGNYIIGRYKTAEEAAIAYNKAVDILLQKGVTKNYTKNYIESYSNVQYAKEYSMIRISQKIREFQI